MWMRFEPSADTLISALESEVADSGESVIDCWFRLSFRVKFALANRSIAIFDDAGYFFQKWVLALRVESQTRPVSFVAGGWLDFDGKSVTLEDRDQKIVLKDGAVRECASVLVQELQDQLGAMKAAYPNDAAEIAFTADTYLSPLQTFLKNWSS